MVSGINIYCDESTHLQHDGEPYLVLGGIRTPIEKASEANRRIVELKAEHGFHARAELKWGKASPKAERLYRAVIDYFFDDDDLEFRCVVATKKDLDFERFRIAEGHDGWYYRMYFNLLKRLIVEDQPNHIYIDIKDTRGADKVRTLQDVLANSTYDFDKRVVRRLQTIRSHEVQLMQLVDLLIGAVNYVNRGKTGSATKLGLASRVQQRSGKRLTRSTLLSEQKFNLFHWQPRP